MKFILTCPHRFGVLMAATCWMLTSCSIQYDLIEAARIKRDRKVSLQPEAVWNSAGLWQRVHNQPATYIPQGYALNAPRTEQQGKWIEDKRDGKRFFIPNEPVGGNRPGMLLGEAQKLTNTAPFSAVTSRHSGIMWVP